MAWLSSSASCPTRAGSANPTLARALAVEAVRDGTRVLLADVDEGQHTSFKWKARRAAFGIKPDIDVKAYERGPDGSAAEQAFARYRRLTMQ